MKNTIMLISLLVSFIYAETDDCVLHKYYFTKCNGKIKKINLGKKYWTEYYKHDETKKIVIYHQTPLSDHLATRYTTAKSILIDYSRLYAYTDQCLKGNFPKIKRGKLTVYDEITDKKRIINLEDYEHTKQPLKEWVAQQEIEK